MASLAKCKLGRRQHPQTCVDAGCKHIPAPAPEQQPAKPEKKWQYPYTEECLADGHKARKDCAQRCGTCQGKAAGKASGASRNRKIVSGPDQSKEIEVQPSGDNPAALEEAPEVPSCCLLCAESDLYFTERNDLRAALIESQAKRRETDARELASRLEAVSQRNRALALDAHASEAAHILALVELKVQRGDAVAELLGCVRSWLAYSATLAQKDFTISLPGGPAGENKAPTSE